MLLGSSALIEFHTSLALCQSRATLPMHCLPQRLKSTFFEIFSSEGSQRRHRVKKKFQKTLILFFEVTQTHICNWNFFHVLAHWAIKWLLKRHLLSKYPKKIIASCCGIRFREYHFKPSEAINQLICFVDVFNSKQ